MTLHSTKNIVVVLGMHRSGTSVMARALQVLGIGLGDNIMPPLADNPKGFWEDMDVWALNEQIFAHFGESWHSLTPSLSERLRTDGLERFRERACELLRRKTAGVDWFGMKDPRVARLLPFWRHVFADMGISPFYLIAIRNPLSVAASLAKRDGFAKEKSFYLWAQHMIPAVLETTGARRTVVDFDRLMASPQVELRRVASVFGIADRLEESELGSFCSSFLEAGLRHAQYSLDHLGGDPAVPRLVVDVYATLSLDAAGELSIDSSGVMSRFHRFGDDLEALGPALSLMSELDRVASAERERATARDEQIASLTQSVTERDRQIASLTAPWGERDELLAQLQQAGVERDRLATSLTQAVAERDNQIVSLRVARADRDEIQAQLEQAGTERDRLVANLTQSVAERDRQIISLTAELAECAEIQARLQQAGAERDGLVAQLTHAVAERDSRIATLTQSLAECEAHAASRSGVMVQGHRLVPNLDGDLANCGRMPDSHDQSMSGNGVNGCRSEQAEQEEVIARLSQSLVDREWQATNLTGRLANAERAAREAISDCDAVLLSTTWRFTKPLREILTLVRPVRHRLRSLLQRGRINQGVVGEESYPGMAATKVSGDEAPATAQPERLGRRPYCLVIDSQWPQPDRDSGSLDAIFISEAIREMGFEVVFASDAEYAADPGLCAPLSGLGITCLGPQLYPSIQTFLAAEGSLLDLVILSRSPCGGRYFELVRRECAKAKVVFNTVDLHGLREEREARLRGDRVALTRALEQWERELYLTRQADATIVVSQHEAELLRVAVPGADVHVFPLVRQGPGARNPFRARRGIGFVGGFGHVPNVDAVVYFLREIWPAVLTAIPDCQFSVVGADLPQAVQDELPEQTCYLGRLPDIGPWFDNLRVTVAPLRYGAGAKGKVASSLAHGVPCVLTKIAAEGMGLASECGVLVADDAASFARAVVRLYTDEDLWARVSEGGLQFAGNELSPEAGKRHVEALLRRMGFALAP